MDRSCFIGSFQLLPGELTSTTAVDWDIKVKDKKGDVGLTKNDCITQGWNQLFKVGS